MKGLFSGFMYPFRALAVINRTPSLWGYVIIPIFMNLAVGALVYAGLLVAGLRSIDSLVGQTTGGTVLDALLRLILVVALLLGVGFVLVRFGVVLGSPWYGKLSEELERLRIGRAPPAEPLTPRGIIYDLTRAVAFELQKLLLIIGVGLLLLLVNFVPVGGQVLGTIGGMALGVTITCLDFLDGPLARRHLSFREKLGFVRQSFPSSAGFGLVCLGLVSIPLINLLSIPLCVTAGTLFFCDRIQRDLHEKNREQW